MEKVDIVSLQGVISGIHNQMNGVEALKSVRNHSTVRHDPVRREQKIGAEK